MARYVVTGGAGFIGSHLVDTLLGRGHGVRVVDDLSTGSRDNLDPRAEMIVGDVADTATMRHAMTGAAGCFHLAAVASVTRCTEDWVTSHRTNLGGTVAVLDAARFHGRVPVVYASSAAVYGEQLRLPIREQAPTAPRSSYGADKLGGELQAQAAFITHGQPSMGFRFFNVYGPRQDPRSQYSGVISVFASRLMAGLPITIHGDGDQSRDFIAVQDIVRFLCTGMETIRHQPQARILNACTGRGTTVRDLARIMGTATGVTANLVPGPARPGDIRASIGDPSHAENVLGIRAQIELGSGLRGLFSAPLAFPHAA